MGARQPFRIEGDKAYGLGIADDKQGIAVILHAVAMLQKLGFKDYGAHSADAEYVLIDSIEPRLYLVTRMVMDLAQGKVAAR